MPKLLVPQSRRHNAAMLYVAVLLTGSCGLAYEYTISKVASDLLGNSSRQWAMIIGVMMFFMGLGANYQKVLPERMLFAWFVLLELLLSLLGGPIAVATAVGLRLLAKLLCVVAVPFNRCNWLFDWLGNPHHHPASTKALRPS